eukprot:UN28531
MLPAILSTDLCSLWPDVDRLTFSIIFNMTSEGKVISSSFHKAVINSKKKFSYQEAQNLLDSNTREGFAGLLKDLHSISEKLHNKRIEQGCLELGGTELEFDLDKDNSPTDMKVKHPLPTNQLIEEFMVLANCTVAHQNLIKHPKTAILRNHNSPVIPSLERISQLLKE